MTLEGYDFEYALTMGTIEPWGYGSYNATTDIISIMEVVIDPPPCACQDTLTCRTHKRSGEGCYFPAVCVGPAAAVLPVKGHVPGYPAT